MILANQITLESRHRDCIWCDRRFLPRGFKQDRAVNFGPVDRSEEHLFPQNVFGTLVSLDLCKGCNEMFGARVDHHLLRDERVITAATKAGIDNRELLTRFRGTQSTEDGREFEVTLQNGHYRITPRFADLMQLGVGSVGGKILPSDLVALKQRLQKKIQEKRGVQELSNEDKVRIDRLIESIVKHPDQIHYDPILQEGFKPRALSKAIKVQLKCDPWITDWCVAKILFTTAASLIPDQFLLYLQPVQKYLRDFVRHGLEQEYTGTGKSIFQSGSDDLHAPKHSVVISATQKLYSGELRFFGSAWWRFSCPLTPGARRPRDNGFRVEIVNSFATEDAKSSVAVTPLE